MHIFEEQITTYVSKFGSLYLINHFLFIKHSYPKWEYKMKNVSEVWCIFLKS